MTRVHRLLRLTVSLSIGLLLSCNRPPDDVAVAPTHLTVTKQPTSALYGQALSPTLFVEIRDAAGARVTGASDLVTASIATGGGQLTGTATVRAVDGVAIFPDLAIGGVGHHVIRFTSGTLTGAATDVITVAQPAGSLVVFAGAASGDGSVDGTGAAARFFYPKGVAIDAEGNLYVADSQNHTVRRVTAAGVVTTLAGAAGQLGGDDGPATFARFFSPSGVAVDRTGNVFVADCFNHTIRKVAPDGAVATLAGAPGAYGSTDGSGADARFNCPADVGLDQAGNLYVADMWNHTIRKVTPFGLVTTFAGTAGQAGAVDGSARVARFQHPAAVAVDRTGTVYVSEPESHTIRRITSGGAVTTLAGAAERPGYVDAVGMTARFYYPGGLTLDSAGNLLVADSGNHTIRKLTADGVVTTWLGAAGQSGSADGLVSAARFFLPAALAVDGAGHVFVSDSGNNTIRKVSPDGAVTTFVGTASQSGSADGGGTAARFANPNAVAVDAAGNLYVADASNLTIRKVTPNGIVTTLAGAAGQGGWADGPGPDARFLNPLGIAATGDGVVYVADTGNSTVRRIAPDGFVVTFAGAAREKGGVDGTGPAARLDAPVGIAVDADGNVYVADTGNCTIRKISAGGVVTTLAGSPGVPGHVDAVGAAARFHDPVSVAVDRGRNVFVAERLGHDIRKIGPDGTVTTLAGQYSQRGSVDGPGPAARFFNPSSLALDGDGNVYVADTRNGTIRFISSTGVVTTRVGAPGQLSNAPGPLPALLAFPWGVAHDPARGALYVAVNDAILRVQF